MLGQANPYRFDELHSRAGLDVPEGTRAVAHLDQTGPARDHSVGYQTLQPPPPPPPPRAGSR